MTIKDWIDLGYLVVWLGCLIAGSVLGHTGFKNKKSQRKAEIAKQKVDDFVAYYDKQELSNPQKLNGVISDTASFLKSKGFHITDQDLKAIEAMAEYAVTALRIKQTQLPNDNHEKDADKELSPISNEE